MTFQRINPECWSILVNGFLEPCRLVVSANLDPAAAVEGLWSAVSLLLQKVCEMFFFNGTGVAVDETRKLCPAKMRDRLCRIAEEAREIEISTC